MPIEPEDAETLAVEEETVDFKARLAKADPAGEPVERTIVLQEGDHQPVDDRLLCRPQLHALQSGQGQGNFLIGTIERDASTYALAVSLRFQACQ